MVETTFVWAVSKSTGQKQRIPAVWLEHAKNGIEPFTDFKLTPSQRNRIELRETAPAETPVTNSKKEN